MESDSYHFTLWVVFARITALAIAVLMCVYFHFSLPRAKIRRNLIITLVAALLLVPALSGDFGGRFRVFSMGWSILIPQVLLIGVLSLGIKHLRIRQREIWSIEDRCRILEGDLAAFIREGSSEAEKSQVRLQDISRIAPFGFFETDLEGNIAWAGSRCAELVRMGRGEVVDRKWLDAAHDDDRVDAHAAYMKAVTSQSAVTHAFRLKVNPSIWIEVQLLPRRTDLGDVIGFIGTFTDISERRRCDLEHRELENRMQQMQRIESLGVMAAGIAHDFNNLLVSILGGTDLALTMVPQNTKLENLLTIVKDAANRASDLSAQMLSLSGKAPVEFSPTDLNKLVSDMLQLMASSHLKGIDVGVHLAPGLQPVQADSTQVSQVILNIVRNAADSLTNSPRRIEVSTGSGVLSRDQLDQLVNGPEITSGEYVWFEVQDSGHGIQADARDRIFDPFFSTRVTGRGLGMTIVLSNVRRHRGAIDLHSLPDAGTRFRVYLPMFEAPITTS